ncbi:MAG: hypothetical protein JZU63_03090, partial [Rhodoferax sp.]|nr:hypothetical protein [Rhodoferax sp.]
MLEILSVFFHDSWRIAIVFYLCMILTVVVSFLPAKNYTSDAALLLRLGREYLYKPEVGESTPGSPVAYDRD